MTTAELMTVGYEGSTLPAVLDVLAAAHVAVLIDVRALPQSRKPGFSKRQLAAGMDERGTRYLHLPDLGTPKPGRDAARRGDVATMHRVFAAQMATEGAKAALSEAIAVASRARTCLLCFEHDYTHCHRTIVADAIAAATGQTVTHLDGRLLLG